MPYRVTPILAIALALAACAPPPPEPPSSRSRFASHTPSPVFAVDISMWSETVADHQMDCMWDAGVRHVIVGTQVPRIARQQLEMAVARGMTVDAYVYLWWSEDMTTQVRESIELVESYPVGRLWLDIEDDPGGRSPAQLEALIQDGLDACGSFPCGIYTGAWWWRPHMADSDAFAHVPLWYAWYDLDPSMDTWTTQRFGGWESPVGKQWNEQRTCDVVGDVNTMNVDAEPSVPHEAPPSASGIPPAPSGAYPDGVAITNGERVRTMVRTIGGATLYEQELQQWNGREWRHYWAPSAEVSSIRWNPPYPNRAYRWRARATNAAGTGPWSAWARFDVGAVASPPPSEPAEPPPGEPPPSEPPPGGPSPADGARVASRPVTLSRDPVGGADGYEVEIEHHDGSAFRPYYTYAPSVPRQTFWPAYADRAYRWRTRARVSGAWGSWSDWAIFLLGDAGPLDPPSEPPPSEPPPRAGAPTWLTPDGARVSGGAVMLGWTGVEGADRYEAAIEYATGGGAFRTYFTYSPSGTAQSFWPSVHGATYRFRARARVGGVWGDWSGWASFDYD